MAERTQRGAIVRRMLSPLRRRVSNDYSTPSKYWDRRAPELIATYRRPDTWASRGWNIARSPESKVVPDLLESVDARSVLVVGAGSGRQYEYLEQQTRLNDLRGFDLSPTMVRECQARFPRIPTVVDDVINCGASQQPADVVLAVTVLQHVRPSDIRVALEAVASLANKAIVILEFTRLTKRSGYMFAHPYRDLMEGWTLTSEQIVEEGPSGRTELLAWLRPGTSAAHDIIAGSPSSEI